MKRRVSGGFTAPHLEEEMGDDERVGDGKMPFKSRLRLRQLRLTNQLLRNDSLAQVVRKIQQDRSLRMSRGIHRDKEALGSPVHRASASSTSTFVKPCSEIRVRAISSLSPCRSTPTTRPDSPNNSERILRQTDRPHPTVIGSAYPTR
jgi:hypothetical protein